MEVTYKPTFKEWGEGKISVGCLLTNEDGKKIEEFIVKGTFSNRDEADKHMRDYCTNRGYDLKN